MKTDLTTGKPGKQIFMFTVPMLIGNIFQHAYNLIDSIIVGQFLGKEALAAVGASFPIIFTLISLIVGVAIGSTIMISQYYGAGDLEKVKLINSTLMIFLFVASLLITFTGTYWTEFIFRLIQLPEELMEQAVVYLRTYLLGLVFFFAFHGIAAVLRGLGDSKTPLLFLSIATVLNILLDLLFIVVLGYGVEGTAIATIISQGVALFSAIIYLQWKDNIIQFKFSDLKFDKALFTQSIKLGLPPGLQNTIVSLGMMAVFSIVNTFGTSVAAAYSVASRLDALATLPAMNFANALTTFVGQNIGAKQMNRVKKGYVSTMKMTILASLIITVVFFFFSENLMMMFTKQQDVVQIGVEYLTIVSIFYFLFSAMFANHAVMRGAGDTLIPMFITLISLWVIRVPASYFLSEIYGSVGIWWALPITWFVGYILSFIYYKTGRWKKKSVVSKDA